MSRTELMRLKIAVLAPMPKPRISTAVMVKAGDFRRRRSVWRIRKTLVKGEK